ncbi:MAG: sporulation integral membrane protein YtvI [Acetatifactor sp.]|nr:sporulation integral membrane protein YtvI [Acetatifactor sp.]
MKKYSKALVNLAIALVVLLGIIFLVPRALMFFLPFVIGWIIALMASPLVRFFEEKIRLKRKIGSAFVIIAVIGLLVLLIYFVCAWLAEQVGGLLKALPDMWAGLEADIDNMGHSLSSVLNRLPGDTETTLNNLADTLSGNIGDFIERFGTPTIEAAGSFAMQLPSIFIGIIMALLSAYFFVAERQQINEWFRKHTPATLQLYYGMVRQSLVKSVGGYLKAQLKIEVWMYLLLVVGLGILGVNYFGLIALVIAILDFLPFLGTGTVLIPWAVIKIFAADYQVAVGLLIIWCVGQLARQLIQPKIVGDSIGVPPLPTLVLLYVGYQVGGVVGMILAVPLGLMVYSMYQEGVFNSVRDSILILTAGINRFRRLHKEDMSEVEEMSLQNEEAYRIVEERRQRAAQEDKDRKKARKVSRRRLRSKKDE